jgi:membrane protein implicated in regulation of membrane protease activity
MADRPPKRTLTTLAVALLLLDGVLLLLASWYLRNWGMALLGALLVAMSVVVILYYRRYARAMAEVQQAKDALRVELNELKRLVKERDQQQ